MSLSHHSTADQTIAVSNPGGLSRQYRVQVQTNECEWHMHGSFHSREKAEDCLRELNEHGDQARMVTYRIAAAA